MAKEPTINPVLDIALDRLIADAAGFRARDPRTKAVLIRFTEPELELLDRLAGDKGITRIELIRRLLDLGIGQEHRAARLAEAASNLVKMIRRARLLTTLGNAVQAVEGALAELRPAPKPTARQARELLKRLGAVALSASVLLSVQGCGLSHAELQADPQDPGAGGPAWTVQHDPNGRGYWAGPAGGTLRFYPSSHSYPARPYRQEPRP